MRDRGRSAAAAELATLPGRPLISVVMPVYDVEPAPPARGDRLGPRPALSGLGAGHRRRRIHPRGHPQGGEAGRIPRFADHARACSSENVGDLGRLQPGPRALPRRARRLPGPRRRAHARCPAAGRERSSRSTSSTSPTPTRTRSPRTARGSIRSTSPTGRPSTRWARCTSATCWWCAESSSRRSGASIPASTRSRTSSCCCASPSAPTGSTTSRRRSTTGGRSRAASRSRSMRRRASPNCRPARSTLTSAGAASRRRPSRTRRSPTGCDCARPPGRRRPPSTWWSRHAGTPTAHSTPVGRRTWPRAAATAEFIVFVGEQTEMVEPDWIEQLLLYAEMPGVGAVGPTITRPDGRVDSAGYAIGLYDPAAPVMRGFDGGRGRLLRLALLRPRGLRRRHGVHAGRALDLRPAGRLRGGLSPASSRISTSAFGSGTWA